MRLANSLDLCNIAVMRQHKRSLAPKGDARYRRMWRVINGAVADAFKMHPDYVEPERRRAARESIVKRVTGAVLSSFPETGRATGKTGS